MSERDYVAEVNERANWTPPSPPPPVDDAKYAATKFEGVSDNKQVSAFVFGSLEFSHVEITSVKHLDTIGADIVQAVNRALSAAQGGAAGDLDKQVDDRIAEFEAEIEKLDKSLDNLDAWLDELNKQLDEPDSSSLPPPPFPEDGESR